MNCNEDDVDKLLSCLGIQCKSNIICHSHLIILWNITNNFTLNEEERSKLVISHLTRLFMRYSVTPIIPHNYYKTNELFECNYQYPWYSTITYLLCAKQAGNIHKDSTKYIIDLALLNDQLGGRPFIKHRKLQMRILGSLLINEIKSISKSIESHFNVDKVNIGALGNMVPQLHVHIIGRYKNDRAWPKAIWGTKSSGTSDKMSSRLIDIFS